VLLRIRRAEVRLIFSRRAISALLTPSLYSVRTSPAFFPAVRGRPKRFPLSLASAMPARIRSQRISVFAEFEHEILRERIRAGIAEARLQGRHLGRPVTVGKKASQIRKLYRGGVSKAEIARRLEISRTSVRRILGERNRT